MDKISWIDWVGGGESMRDENIRERDGPVVGEGQSRRAMKEKTK